MFHRSGIGRSRLLALTAAAAMAAAVLAGCGSGDTPAETPTADQSADTSAGDTAPADSDSGSSSDSDAPAPSDGTDAAPASYPVTVTADNGEVTVERQPTAIASLSPTATEMLYAIGAGDDVVVVDMFSDYPTDLPDARVDAYQLNIESLTEFDPDLVVTSSVTPDQQQKFDALGMTTIAFGAPADIDGMYAQITTLGEVTGHIAGATALVTELKAEIADITAQMPAHDTPYSYYYELDQTYYSVTSNTFIGQLLGMLGMESIADDATGAAESGGYPQLDAEFIVNADPDYIMLADTICCEQNAATVADRDGWGTLSAVAADRIIELDDNLASRWAPRITELLRQIVKAVADHPVN